MSCDTCNYAEKIKYLEKSFDDIKQSSKEESEKNALQHKEFYNAISEIKLASKDTQADVKLMRNDLQQVLKLFEGVQKDTEEMKQKPSKRIESISLTVTCSTITLIISIFVNYLLNK